ncbi:MAG: ferrous iron transport protein A [Halanaerobiales bacterium]|nr:ferrous iron transport protein A [Halanaerobiales bacterium]
MASALPLGLMVSGQNGKIKEIVGGKGFRERLMEMGFNKGSTIKVIRNDSGPLIVIVKESRMAVGRGMAQKIFVEGV